MPETILLERAAIHVPQPDPIHGQYSLGAFRLAPPPPHDSGCLPEAGIDSILLAHPEPSETTLRPRFASSWWYDIAVSLLILACSAVALYLLITMGQP